MVFYFTATGNSLYVAKQFSENPISIPQVKSGMTFKDDKIGIVCPVYCGEIPKAVFRFIKNTKFETEYLFLILTYGMNESDSAEFTFNQCKKQGVHFDYIACIKMVDNYLPAFDMAAQRQIDKKITEQLTIISEDINDRKKGFPTATDADRKLHKRVALMNKLFPSANNGGALKITGKCVGCKVCEKVCPIGNIVVLTDYAQRLNKKCEFCLACIHNCPNNAIALKREKNPSERYRNENVTLEEIINANNQRKD